MSLATAAILTWLAIAALVAADKPSPGLSALLWPVYLLRAFLRKP